MYVLLLHFFVEVGVDIHKTIFRVNLRKHATAERSFATLWFDPFVLVITVVALSPVAHIRFVSPSELGSWRRVAG